MLRRKRINQMNGKRELRRGLNKWPLHLSLSPGASPSEMFLIGRIAWQYKPICPLFTCRLGSLYKNIEGKLCTGAQNCCNCSVSLILLSCPRRVELNHYTFVQKAFSHAFSVHHGLNVKLKHKMSKLRL